MSAIITKILCIEPMIGYDSVELATVFNWKVAVVKGKHKLGELAIYYGIGSILPKDGDTAFLEGHRLKTKKFRDYISQGLIGPIEWLRNRMAITGPTAADFEITDGMDVTTIMGVTKYIPPEELDVYQESETRGKWPSHIPKTDEERGQYCLSRLQKYVLGKDPVQIVITKKYDGTSATFMWNASRFIICSRNNELLRCVDEPGKTCNEKPYFDIAEKHNLKEKMTSLGTTTLGYPSGRMIAIQGEIVGPKINGNRLKLKENAFFVFNIYDIQLGAYLQWDEVVTICKQLGLNTVDVVYHGPLTDDHLNMDWLLNLAAEQTYASGTPCEGIVIKTDSIFGRFSCKVISNKYILKHGL